MIVVTVAMRSGWQRWHCGLWLALGLILPGLALVFGASLGGNGLDPLDIAASLMAAVAYGTFILASEPLSNRIDPFLFTALVITSAASATGLLTIAHAGVPATSVTRAACHCSDSRSSPP